MPRPTRRDTPGETVILGYGKFGRRALVSLQAMLGPQAPFVVVDREAKADSSGRIRFVCADGVEWLSEYLGRDGRVERIIPALPLHLAAGWLAARLTGEGWTARPLPLGDALLACLPHAFHLSATSAVTSHADFLCPDNCPEPELICTHTGLARPTPLYRLLRAIHLDGLTPLVVVSRQFAPGVGGFFPEDLLNLLNLAKRLPAQGLLIATACKCHGIVDGLYREKRSAPVASPPQSA